jgi:hypothetical protein
MVMVCTRPSMEGHNNTLVYATMAHSAINEDDAFAYAAVAHAAVDGHWLLMRQWCASTACAAMACTAVDGG